MNLHVSTQKAVVGSKRWIIKAPVQEVVITCIEVPEEKKNYTRIHIHIREESAFPALFWPKEKAEQ